MNVASYARVSGASQEENTSLGNQFTRSDAYALSRGYTVTARAYDIVSGEFVMARSEFNRLLDMARRGEIGRIIVDVPDRLGRGHAMHVLENKAKEAGAPVEYATEQPDRKTLIGVITDHTSALVSAVERHNIKRRMSQGRIAKARSGQIIAGRVPKFGYRYEYEIGERGKVISCKLVIDDEKIAIYRMIVGWVIDGIPGESVPPMSVRQVIKRLLSMSIPSPSGNQQWSYRGIYKILTSPVYVGRWEYGRNVWELQDTPSGAKGRVVGRRSDEDTIVVAVPAAIDEATWQRLQAQLKANRTDKFRPREKGEYLARSICQCASCGYTLLAERMKAGNGTYYTYYTCHHRRHNFVNACRAGSVRSNVIDDMLWRGVCAMVNGNDDAIRAGQQDDAGRVALPEAYDRQIKIQQGIITKCETEMKRLARRQIGGVGAVSKKIYTEMESEINARAERATAEIARLRLMRRDAEDAAKRARTAADLKRELSESVNNDAPFAMRRAIIERLKVRCTWDSNTRVLSVSCIIGFVALSQ